MMSQQTKEAEVNAAQPENTVSRPLGTKETSETSPLRPTAKRIFLVRHGETSWNREGRFQGQIDVPLNDIGLRQADAVAEALKEIPFDRIISSNLSRALRTALPLASRMRMGMGVETDDDLKEIGHGLWEGRTAAEVEAMSPGALALWHTHPEAVVMPEGESLADVQNRAWPALLRIAEGKGRDRRRLHARRRAQSPADEGARLPPLQLLALPARQREHHPAGAGRQRVVHSADGRGGAFGKRLREEGGAEGVVRGKKSGDALSEGSAGLLSAKTDQQYAYKSILLVCQGSFGKRRISYRSRYRFASRINLYISRCFSWY